MENYHISNEEIEDAVHEECGVFGIYDLDGNDIASLIYTTPRPLYVESSRMPSSD